MVLGSLVVNMRANTDAYVQGMDRARARTAAVGRATRAVRGSVLAFGRGMLAIAGIGGIGAMVRGTLKSTDALQKLSVKLGESVENLSRLQHVADLSGVDFRSMTMGLQRMTRRISEAAVGGGEAKDVIRDLGLNAQELKNMPLAEQFLTVTKAMERLTNSGTRVRVAMKFFDSEGVSLLQTMENGAQGIRDMMAESDALGKTRTTAQGEAGARVQDALTRLGGSITGAAGAAILQFADPIANLLDTITGKMPAISESVREASAWIREAVSEASALFNEAKQIFLLFKGVADRMSVPESIARKGGPMSQISDVVNSSSIGRVAQSIYNNRLFDAFMPGRVIGERLGVGAAATGVRDVVNAVNDPQNAEIIKLLKAMLGALRNDPGTAVAG